MIVQTPMEKSVDKYKDCSSDRDSSKEVMDACLFS